MEFSRTGFPPPPQCGQNYGKFLKILITLLLYFFQFWNLTSMIPPLLWNFPYIYIFFNEGFPYSSQWLSMTIFPKSRSILIGTPC